MGVGQAQKGGVESYNSDYVTRGFALVVEYLRRLELEQSEEEGRPR